MKERASWPMKAWEVRAILEGRKTQTRRIAKVMNNNRVRTGPRSVAHITDPVVSEL